LHRLFLSFKPFDSRGRYLGFLLIGRATEISPADQASKGLGAAVTEVARLEPRGQSYPGLEPSQTMG